MSHHQAVACALCGGGPVEPFRQLQRTYRDRAWELSVVRCRACRFAFLWPAPDVDYDDRYLVDEGVTSTLDPAAAFRVDERLAAITRFFGEPEGCRLLDIGIGDGLLLARAEALGYVGFGLDVNPAAVRRAREVNGVAGSLSTDPLPHAFAGQTFDVIHMNEVIEHVPDPLTLLHWCREHLAAGGVLVVQTGNVSSLAARLKARDWDYFRPVHLNYFSTRTLADALSRAGFRVMSTRTTDWRLASTLRTAVAIARQYDLRQGIKLLAVYLSSRVHGVRRTVLVHASPRREYQPAAGIRK